MGIRAWVAVKSRFKLCMPRARAVGLGKMVDQTFAPIACYCDVVLVVLMLAAYCNPARAVKNCGSLRWSSVLMSCGGR